MGLTPFEIQRRSEVAKQTGGGASEKRVRGNHGGVQAAPFPKEDTRIALPDGETSRIDLEGLNGELWRLLGELKVALAALTELFALAELPAMGRDDFAQKGGPVATAAATSVPPTSVPPGNVPSSEVNGSPPSSVPTGNVPPSEVNGSPPSSLPSGDLPRIIGRRAGGLPLTGAPAESSVSGWLVSHRDAVKNQDGSYSITGGEYSGSTAVPTGGGNYTIVGPDGKASGTYSAPAGQSGIASPLVFDLDDNGVGTTSVREGRTFDIDGDGKADQTSWAADGDGLLVFDRDGDGVSGADGRELLGNHTDLGDGIRHANGFAALKALAARHLGANATSDGKLNAAELKALEKRAGLMMLIGGERQSLASLGITEVSLAYREAGQNADANGNEHRQVGTGFVQNGKRGAVNDVWFRFREGSGNK